MLIRKSFERGKNSIPWLDANHTFSFGHYYDPNWTNFNNLLVINEDTIAQGKGFGTHPHKDMEIITFIIDGEIKHLDSMGSQGFIKPGEIQVMSAGTGVTHSEFNNLLDKPTHLLQIWILPSANSLKPRYDQRKIHGENENNFFKKIAGKTSDDSIISLNALGQVWLGKYNKKSVLEFTPEIYNSFWLQIVSGTLIINGQTFTNGDGIGFPNKEKVEIEILENGAEFLVLEVSS